MKIKDFKDILNNFENEDEIKFTLADDELINIILGTIEPSENGLYIEFLVEKNI